MMFVAPNKLELWIRIDSSPLWKQCFLCRVNRTVVLGAPFERCPRTEFPDPMPIEYDIGIEEPYDEFEGSP